MALWNERNINKPEMETAPVSSGMIKPDICALAITTHNTSKYLNSMRTFESTDTLVNKFCVLFKHRLRHYRVYQLMRQLNQTLRRIKTMNLVDDVFNFSGLLPDVDDIPQVVNLPVRSNLEYLLVRFQGLMKLFMRALFLAKAIVRYDLSSLAFVRMFGFTATSLAVMGEMWVLLRNDCRKLVQLYSEFHAHLLILPKTNKSWLPKDYHLPASLTIWLGKEYDEEIGQSGNIIVDSTIPSSKKKLNTEDEVMKEIATIATEAKGPKHNKASFIVTNKPGTMELELLQDGTNMMPPVPEVTNLVEPARKDTEEVVPSREDVGTAFNRPLHPVVAKNLDNIRSKFHVKLFIDQERVKRVEHPSKAATCNLSDTQFNVFYTNLTQEFNRLSSGDFVALFKNEFVALLQK